MILADDNFATIIGAVANGRNVYRNIRNAILFLLSGNMAGILAVLYTSIPFAQDLPVPFAPVHLLFINLLTDSLPALAIGMEPMDGDVLSEKPRDPKEGILTRAFLTKLLVQGGLIAVATMAAFYMGLETSDAMASTMAFATLTLARLFHGFNCRSKHSIFKVGFFRQLVQPRGVRARCSASGRSSIYSVLPAAVSVEVMSVAQLGYILLFAVLPTVLIQAYKVISDIIRK